MDPLQLADLEVYLETEKKELKAKEKELEAKEKELVEKSAPTDGNEWMLLVAQQNTLAAQQNTLAAQQKTLATKQETLAACWKGKKGPFLPFP